jgi:hypothetical protein
MADEIPPAPSENPDDVTKSETIRITLPPKSEQPAVKRETVRINVPGKPTPPATGIAPKKETTKLPTEAGGSAIAPPPAPKPLPTVGLPPVKPMSGVNMPPKPPSLGARPTVPLKPAPAPTAMNTPEPVTQKAAAPKKETARITLPPEGTSKPALPKATVKMQQTQPLVKSQSAMQPAPQLQQQAPVMMQAGPASDPLMGPLSIAAFVLSIAAAGVVYLIFAAASTQIPL